MKNINKPIVIFLTIFMLFSTHVIADDKILPLPKPSVDLETKNITIKKKRILPEKKPLIKKTLTEEKNDTQTYENDEKIVSEDVIIYPKSKPIIVQKKVDKIAKKSSLWIE